jgi:hypothetical protein
MGPRELALLLVVVGMGAACSPGGSPTGATRSPVSSPVASASASPNAAQPTASSAPAPKPVIGAYGALVTPITGSAQYTVALIGIDGKVAASAQTTSPAIVTCPGAGAPVPLPVSTSNSRLYFMDGQGTVYYLSPSGETGKATSVPAGTASRRAMFAVSPDDQRIAVIVNDYSSSGASTRLYVEDLGGANHVEVYSQTGAKTLWPIGWHGTNNLVVAVVPSCTQGGGPFCCGIQELHVVDPATAARRFTIGNVTSCPIVGPASPAGDICWDGSQSKVLNWTAATVRTYPQAGPALQFLSPNGSQVAVVDNVGTTIQGKQISMAGLFACGWIDDLHVLAGGDSQHQPRVGDLNGGSQIPVAAQGDCAGRLPGGL